MSITHWLIVLAVVLLIFGTGKISGLMGDFAKGIKAFKKGLKEDDEPTAAPKTIEANSAAPAAHEKDRATTI